ncbi:hypothetical protein AB0C10_21485 [Microbispora amethystogenes]|uniref:hypothetical protein n=1 Tax=Microbispora amethystogenes TaxID=1427754 RepID=UPI0033F2C1FE
MIRRIREALAQFRAVFADRPFEIEFPESDELAVVPAAPPAAAAAGDPDDDGPEWEKQLVDRALAEGGDTFQVPVEISAADTETWSRIQRGDELLDEVAAEIASVRGRRTTAPRREVFGG